MTSTHRTVDQMSYRLICRTLRGVLQGHTESGEVDLPECRAVAALYTLLLEHSIDRRGRCRSCGRVQVVFRCRRQCRIYRVARYWVHRSPALLVASLVSELGLAVGPPPVVRPEPDWPGLTITGRSDPEDTDELPRIEAAQTGAHVPNPPQAPAVSSPLPAPGSDVPGAGWPDSDHGGTGVRPDRPRSRRGPPDAPSPDPGVSALAAGGPLCLV